MLFQQFIFSRHLDEEEKILYVGHKHWIEIIEKIFKISFLGLLIPWLLYIFTSALLVLWIVIIITIIVYIKIIYILIDWYLDAVLVTSESLMFVEWHGIFHHESTRIAYESVESINVELKGVLSTVFNFGIVSIEREAAPSIEMNYVRNPKSLELEVVKGKEVYEEKNLGENTDALKDVLANLVSEHIKKHGWRRK